MSNQTELTARARNLRRHSTDAERLLWQHLRNRRMAGLKFRRQVAIDHYIVDFLCVEARLIIEADGGQHDLNRRYDQRREAVLRARGFRVLRFWNNQVLGETEQVLGEILRAVSG